MGHANLGDKDERQSWEDLFQLDETEKVRRLTTLLQEYLAEQMDLSLSEVNVKDSLIDLGLESLVAMDLSSLLEERLGIRNPLSEFLYDTSIEQLAEAVSRQQWVSPSSQETSDESRIHVETEYPLSKGQEALWFLQRMDPDCIAYNVKFGARICSDFDMMALQQAIKALITRHPSLRTTFHDCNGRLVQRVNAFQESQIQVIEYEEKNSEDLEKFLEQQAFSLIDLERGPVFRVLLIPRKISGPIMLMIAHHIVIDLWSLTIMIDELRELYAAERSGRLPYLSTSKGSYSDFVQWQTGWLTSSEGDRQLNYWKTRLGRATSVLQLPMDCPRPVSPSYQGNSYFLEMNAQLTNRLKMLARVHGVTLYVLLLAAFQVLLSRYSGQEDIAVASPCVGRPRSEYVDIVGYFVNMLVIKGRLAEDPSFSQFLQQIRKLVLEALDNHAYPFPLLVEQLQPQRDNVSPLYQTMFVFQKPHRLEKDGLAAFILGEKTKQIGLGDLVLESMAIKERGAQVDLTLIMVEVDDSLQASFQYNADLFKPSTIERIADHFLTLLESIVGNPDEPISRLSLLSESETHHLLVEWNQTEADYPHTQCVHQLIEKQSERFPDAAAATFEGQQLTYRELNQRANQMAHYLLGLGVGPEVLVGICMERSLEMIVGLLGIWKAGGAYVPLDPALPQERLAFMLQDTQARIVLSSKGVVIPPMDNRLVVDLVSDWELIARESVESPEVPVRAQHLAYILYTSGTLGRPKGVMIEHHGLTNLVQEQLRLFEFSSHSRVLQFSSLSFDASVFEILMALTRGATLILGTVEALLPGPPLLQFLRDNRITTATLPPSVLQTLPVTHLPDLQVLNVAGEACPQELVDRWSDGRDFFNLYGPTETTIWASYARCSRQNSKPVIGRPLGNFQIYILNQALQPVPIGVPGELYIGGIGVARGYVNLPDQTRERFISNPFQPGTRMYKTGDSARYLPDGNLEFLGRIDHQVKIHGFRIELQEIEGVLSRHPDVQEVVVGVVEGNGGKNVEQEESQKPGASDKKLVAYIVPASASKVIAQDLRQFLQQKLPRHMIPAIWVPLDVLPHLPNGKVDRKALQSIDHTLFEETSPLMLPRDPVEGELIEIWREVLGIEHVGVHDNFFELGGHSLLATQIFSRVWNVFHVELPLRSIFEQPTIAELAKRITNRGNDGSTREPSLITAVSPKEEPVLSFSQERMWFLYHLESGGPAYSIPFTIRLTGPLQMEVLETCLNEIRKRHEVFRTTVETRDGKPFPIVHPFEKVSLSMTDYQGISESEREIRWQGEMLQDIQQPFDLARGPLVRMKVYCLDEEEYVLLVNMHHIISDAWSMSVFLQEMEALYSSTLYNRPSPLPELPVQYADFAYWQRQWLQGEVLERQLAYWTRHLDKAPYILNLPTDRPRPTHQTFRGAQHIQKLPNHLVDRAIALSREEGVTLFMVMLAVFKILLSRYTGQDDLLVGTPIANRRWLDTEKLIGTFVNTLVLRTNLSGEPTFRTLLAKIKETTLDAYAHQDMPFEQLVEAVQPGRDLSRSPLFQVMFSMPNVPMPKLRVADLDVELLHVDRGGAQFDLTMAVADMPGQGHIAALEYNTDLFDATTITRILDHYQSLLTSALNNPDHPITTLPMITEAEHQQVLVEWNNTEKNYSSTLCLHHLFEQQVERTPDAMAVMCDGEDVSYQELNQRANQVAHYLKKLGVAPEALVGILLDRSVDMLVALLGVLKAGGAYVPLDPVFPQERLRLMMEDSKASVLITQDHLLDRVSFVSQEANGSSVVSDRPKIVTISDRVLVGELIDNPKAGVDSTNLAYVIYTSGSTGKPKGVMIAHQGLVNFINAMEREPGLGAGERFLAVTSLSFDIAALELFLPLVVGAQLVIANRETASDGTKLIKLLKQSKATVMQGTPATWRLLLQAGWKPPHGFRVFCGGEALQKVLADQLLKNEVQLWNLYGPTETTIWSAVHRVLPGEKDVPIGHPIANTQLYVLDRHLQPVPIGVPGELFIGGNGLARGYVNQSALTDQKFLPNPFRTGSTSKIYKTGDLVKYRSDGTLEFLGRLDHQVKIRGYRIELEEIETALNKHPAVQQCLVIVAEREQDNNKKSIPNLEFKDHQLVAYLVVEGLSLEQGPAEDSKTDSSLFDSYISKLREFLQESLPDYMVPSHFVFLEAFPLTPNGKVDRQKLPKPVREGNIRSRFCPPVTPLEHRLAEIWKNALGLQQVGIRDDFFELGGHSLLANQVITRMQAELGINISLTTFFERPTIAYLAKHIETVQWLAESQPKDSSEIPVDREENLL